MFVFRTLSLGKTPGPCVDPRAQPPPSGPSVHHEANLVALQEAADGAEGPFLDLDLLGVVDHQVLVFVEAENPAFDPEIGLLAFDPEIGLLVRCKNIRKNVAKTL